VIRSLAVGAALALAASTLSACSLVTSQACVSWVDFADEQAAFDDATLVVVGVADAADGTVELTSGPGDRHRIAVERVLKGDVGGGELWAAAPRDYCTEDPPQPAVDPIPTGERVVLFLHPVGSSWSGMTPWWTARALPEGAPLPFDVEG